MNVKYYLLLVLISATLCNILPRLSYDTKSLPKVKINLDLPVKERYKDLLLEYKDKVKAYAYVTSLSPLAYIMSKVGKYLINKKTQDKEWYEYIEAVSEYCEITLSEAVMLSVTYDMACTSVIVNDEQDNILMARNLDFGTYFVIAHLMIDVEYFRNDQFLYKGIELIGFRGAINAVKPGMYATSLNLRKSSNTRMGNLWRIYQGRPPPNYNLMKAMLKADSYQEAVTYLSESNLSAPVYYTVAGINKNEGTIISRDHDSVYRTDTLDVDNGRWFLVICNTDLDKEEPQTNLRRIPTENKITKIGRDKINFDNLLKEVMSTYPTNNIITVYTTIQSAQNQGYFYTTLWQP